MRSPTEKLFLETRQEELRDETDADSLAEVFRRAVAVYDFVWSRKLRGDNLFVRTPEGDEEVHPFEISECCR